MTELKKFVGVTEIHPVWPMPSIGRNITLNESTEEKINGQGSTKKQPREEETETGEGKTDGGRIAVFRLAAEAGDFFFTSQEILAPDQFKWTWSSLPSFRRTPESRSG